MFTQTIEQIIVEINIERLKCKQTQKVAQFKETSQFQRGFKNQQSQDESTQFMSPESQRSCSRSNRSCSRSNRSCSRSNRSSMMKKIYQKEKHTGNIDSRKSYRKKWNQIEEQLLCKLIGIHGSDFTFFQKQFPNKTRKQLKKKYQEIHKNPRCISKINLIESALIRSKRKMFFDQQIMAPHPTRAESITTSDDCFIHQQTEQLTFAGKISQNL